MRQSEGVTEFVSYAAEEDRCVFAERHIAVFAVVENRLFPGQICQVLHRPIGRKAQTALLGPTAKVRRVMTKRACFCVVRGQVTEDEHGLTIDRNTRAFEDCTAFAFDHFAASWIPSVSAVSISPAGKIRFRFLAFYQMNDELALGIAREGEGLGTKPQSFHIVAIEALDILQDGVQPLLII